MKNVYLKGPLLSRSGYGEHARFIFRALQSRPDLYRLHVEPTNWGKSSWNLRPTEENTEILNAAKRVNEYVQKNDFINFDRNSFNHFTVIKIKYDKSE